MKINRNDFVASLSFALDFLEISLRADVTNHGKRVCLTANKIARALGLGSNETLDLYACSMLHDNGFTHEAYNALSENGVDRLERMASHCVVGERNMESFPFLEKRENVIKYHHEQYDGSGNFHIKGDDIPLFSRIILLADDVEIAWRLGRSPDDIMDMIKSGRGAKYSPDICDSFGEISRHTSFWLSLGDIFINDELKNSAPEGKPDIGLTEMFSMSEIMCRIIDAKSPFTGKHSRGIAAIAETMADYYGFGETRKGKLVVAANLHDVGKLLIPNKIIDKTGPLTRDEFNEMKGHTFYTRKALEPIKGIEDIVEWASNHHEKLNGLGYPYGLPGSDLSFESQLMACVDIYQALTENRPYRQPISAAEVSSIMTKMATDGLINRDVTADLIERFSDNVA
ncbi:MAG: HD domain-containing protein [Synergistaceae bacterium]|jgi:HD-GYP domain-containing protein (c-di-GMP phosphodiesterase class II)|nr:HD domain-containing protein [Synergistaceae bacterium]